MRYSGLQRDSQTRVGVCRLFVENFDIGTDLYEFRSSNAAAPYWIAYMDNGVWQFLKES
jgi:hypothetical protein